MHLHGLYYKEERQYLAKYKMAYIYIYMYVCVCVFASIFILCVYVNVLMTAVNSAG